MIYLVKTPGVLKRLYPRCTWNFPKLERTIYLTFDDGPHPEATPFVLDTLQRFNAKATFFCIGKNVVKYPDLYKRILSEGHAAGNHTHDHVNGWKVPDDQYMQNIRQAGKYIDSKLFRPPYGRITKFQIGLLKEHFDIIMWDVLSGDFDEELTGDKCTKNVIKNAGPGSIVVYHDSAKAFPRMQKALPDAMVYFQGEGYRFEAIKQ